MLALAITLWVIAGVSFIIFVCSINKIRLAIAIIKSAAIFIKDVPSALIVPIIVGALMVAFWAFWISMAIYVYAIGEIKGSSDSPFASITRSKEADYMLKYELFAFLWTTALLQASCQFILASACSIWYFSQGTG